MATEFVTAIKTSEVPVGEVTAIDVRGTRIAVANVGGSYYAFDDACTHEQCSLAEEGELAGTTLTCNCHGSEFDVRTGKVLAPPATLPVTAEGLDSDLHRASELSASCSWFLSGS